MSKVIEPSYKISLNPQTRFLLSTSGNAWSIDRHNKVLQELGINLVYFTFKHQISAEQYANLLKTPIVRGGAVTGQGLKSSIISHLDEVDQLAQDTNSVNTIVNRSGRLYGYNTDSFGLESALRRHMEKSGLTIRKAIIYGNGGVSGAAAHALKALGITTTMTGRNPTKVAEKMQRLNLEPMEGPYDLVVNATPASSNKLVTAPSLIEVVKDASIVFDHNMPEKNDKTNYLSDYCESHGIYFIPGGDMYVAQMKKQWQLFLDGYTEDGKRQWSISDDDIANYWSLTN